MLEFRAAVFNRRGIRPDSLKGRDPTVERAVVLNDLECSSTPPQSGFAVVSRSQSFGPWQRVSTGPVTSRSSQWTFVVPRSGPVVATASNTGRRDDCLVDPVLVWICTGLYRRPLVPTLQVRPDLLNGSEPSSRPGSMGPCHRPGLELSAVTIDEESAHSKPQIQTENVPVN